jgi:hypothetical protein
MREEDMKSVTFSAMSINEQKMGYPEILKNNILLQSYLCIVIQNLLSPKNTFHT